MESKKIKIQEKRCQSLKEMVINFELIGHQQLHGRANNARGLKEWLGKIFLKSTINISHDVYIWYNFTS